MRGADWTDRTDHPDRQPGGHGRPGRRPVWSACASPRAHSRVSWLEAGRLRCLVRRAPRRWERPRDARQGGREVDGARPIRVALIGAGPEREALAELSGELGVDVKWLGFRQGPALHELYAAADVFVLPSRARRGASSSTRR